MMPVIEQKVEQKLGAMAKPSQGIANRSAVRAERRLSTDRVIARPAEDEDKICWVEMKQYPYQLDHQVELLHLQAEADALLMKLQAKEQRQAIAANTLSPTT